MTGVTEEKIPKASEEYMLLPAHNSLCLILLSVTTSGLTGSELIQLFFLWKCSNSPISADHRLNSEPYKACEGYLLLTCFTRIPALGKTAGNLREVFRHSTTCVPHHRDSQCHCLNATVYRPEMLQHVVHLKTQVIIWACNECLLTNPSLASTKTNKKVSSDLSSSEADVFDGCLNPSC